MKNSTSLLFKLFLFSFILLAVTFKAGAWSSGNFALVSDNTSDGIVVLNLDIHVNGPLFHPYLYFQVKKDGEWQNIIRITHTEPTAGQHFYSSNYYYPTGDVSYSGFQTNITNLHGQMTYTIKGSPTGIYNAPQEYRVLENETQRHTFTATTYRPDAPSNLRVSKDLCNKVDLTWEPPSNVRDNGTNYYEIYRDGNSIGGTSGLSFSNNGTYPAPSDGTVYDYKVRLRKYYNSRYNYGEFSGEVAGNSKPVPEPPTSLTATNDRCDGKISIQWQLTSETPVSYEIQRSLYSTYGFSTLYYSIDGSKFVYEDTPPNRNTIYYYRLRALNDCNDQGPWSVASPGMAADLPAAPSIFASTVSGTNVHLTWQDNSGFETKFVVTRKNLNTGVENNFEVDADVQFYDDTDAQFCVPYDYSVKAVNHCGNSTVITINNVVLPPDLNGTFPPGSLNASKGFFPDVVHIKWDNNNRNQITSYHIYRKIFGSNDSTLITTLDKTFFSYDDKYAENGILYEYSIKAEGDCDGTPVLSNVESDIGFRNPSATVSGKITYGTGSPVKGVTVTAESSDLLETTSLALNGVNSYLEIPNKTSFTIQNAFTFQAFVRLSTIQRSAIFNKNNQYILNYTGTGFEFAVGTDVLYFPHTLSVDTFIHVSAVYDGSSSYLYLNGELAMKKTGVAAVTNNTSPFVIGRFNTSDYLAGNIDEVRIWKTALDSASIFNNYNRYISIRQNDIIGYYRFNENIAYHTFFDISKTGDGFNENHGEMFNSSYSSIIPEIQQLWFRGLTDKQGNYLISGIPYLSDGSSFNIVPMLAPHEFNPTGKQLFMSDASQVHNNIDFTDKSSFMVNGSVIYRNTTRGVKGIDVLVDGEKILGPDAKPEKTDEQGRFEIQVPIGDHYISFEKDGHVFDNGGRYPYDAAHPDSIVRYSFIKNETFGVPFVDTTLITVVGRVIGGTGSNEIPFGFGKSVNNIGTATIILDHSSANPELTFDNVGPGVGSQTISYDVVTAIDTAKNRTYETIQHTTDRTDIETKFYTSGTTGEFVVKLIPEKFSRVSIDIPGSDVETFFDGRGIDLSTNPSLKKEYLYDDDGNLLDSLEYNVKANFIYQTKPEIGLTNVSGNDLFQGEKELFFKNPTTGKEDTIIVADHFLYPMFQMGKDYKPKISVFESYYNFDTGTNTHQSVKEAEVRIVNNLAIKNRIKNYQITPEMDGVVVDTFKAGIPSIVKATAGNTSFTKTMEVYVKVDGITYPYELNGDLYRAYITGQSPKGNNFYTEGPQIPEIILRDPPGSHSSAYIEKGSSYTVSSSYETNFDNGSGFGAEILMGAKIVAGGGLAGPVFETDSKNSGKTNLSFSTTVNEKGEYVRSYAFTERVETSSDPGMVGSMADIYIGKSYNYFYGETDHLKIVPYNLAVQNGVNALDGAELKDTKYTLGIVEGYMMNPDNTDTYFKYTQSHILYKLLPELESRKNNLFLESKRSDGTLKYTSNPLINSSDIRYGVAHSYDVNINAGDTLINAYYVWKTATGKDSINSYTFHPEKLRLVDTNGVSDKTIYENDSVRYYNEQIGIWIDAIRSNEAEKAMAIERNTLEQNISFDGGVGSISRTEVETISYNKEESRTKNMHFGAEGSVGFAFNGFGIVATGELSITHALGVSSGENFSQTMEYGYTLEDGDAGDYYSINVYRRPDKGIYNLNKLQESKITMPANFDFGILGQGAS